MLPNVGDVFPVFGGTLRDVTHRPLLVGDFSPEAGDVTPQLGESSRQVGNSISCFGDVFPRFAERVIYFSKNICFKNHVILQEAL